MPLPVREHQAPPAGGAAVRAPALPRPQGAQPSPRPGGAGVGTGAATLPAEAPAGTDPELWAILSADERTVFAQLGAMGPLSYGRYTESAAPALRVRGGRLDVRG